MNIKDILARKNLSEEDGFVVKLIREELSDIQALWDLYLGKSLTDAQIRGYYRNAFRVYDWMRELSFLDQAARDRCVIRMGRISKWGCYR